MKFAIVIEAGSENSAYGVLFSDIENEIPKAKSMKEHRKNPDYKGQIWSFVDVDMTKFFRES